MKCAVIGPGISPLGTSAEGERSGGSSWQPAKCAVIGPWDLGGSSIRDFLAGGRERRGGQSWPPGSDLTMGSFGYQNTV